MRRLGVTFALAVFLLGTVASEFALARGGGRGGGSHGAGSNGGGHRGAGFHGGKHFHHGHGRVGVFVGAPLVFGGWAYPSPFFYPPPVYYPWALGYPPAYIERGQPVPPQEQPAPAYWYYCPDAKAYYPYVKECPGGWQQVIPQPPPPP